MVGKDDKERIEVEVDNYIPEPHQLVHRPLHLVLEVTIGPEPYLIAKRLSIQVLPVRVLAHLARECRIGCGEGYLEKLALDLRL